MLSTPQIKKNGALTRIQLLGRVVAASGSISLGRFIVVEGVAGRHEGVVGSGEWVAVRWSWWRTFFPEGVWLRGVQGRLVL
jgi:hypothetical protein